MGAMRALLFGSPILSLLIGCSTDEPLAFTDPRWSIQGTVGDSVATVFLSSSNEDLPNELELTVASTAGWSVVLIERDPLTCFSSPNPDVQRLRCYVADLPTFTEVGETYSLAGLADGEAIDGSTTIPRMPDWRLDQPLVQVDTAPVFGRPEPAGRIDLSRTDTAFYWMQMSASIDSLFASDAPMAPNCALTTSPDFPVPASTSFARLSVFSLTCGVAWDSAHATLQIHRYDDNLTEYMDAATSGPALRRSFGINGAWGYWASRSTQRIRFLIVPEAASQQPAHR